jgi:CheY-like chemotaxis protein
MHSHSLIDRGVFNGENILLAEDSENDVLIMRSALERAGVPNPLKVVTDGEEAVAYLAGQGKYSDRVVYRLPVVLFLDLNMPKQGGLEVLQWLRQQSALKRMSVHILSASIRETDVSKAAELGANSYIIKPSKFSDLVTMLKAWYALTQFQAQMLPGEPS